MEKKSFINSWNAILAVILVSSCFFSCEQEDEINPVEIARNLAPTSSFSVQSEGIVGEEIQFYDNSSDQDGSIASWQWNFGDGNTSFDQSPTYSYAAAGIFEVVLRVTDDGGDINTTSSFITIRDDGNEAVPVETGNFDRTFSFDSITREYLLYVPESYTGDVEVPLVVYLHGAPENKEFAPRTTDLVDIAEAEGFILIFAEAGFEVLEDTDVDVYVWADGRGALNGDIDKSIDDVSFVNALVDSISEEFAINAAKRYLCGFSNGGSLTQRIAIESNERFAAMATVAAGLHETYESESPGRAIPMLFIHGTNDPIASYDEGGITEGNPFMFTTGLLSVEESVNYWVNKNQCDIIPVETDLADRNSEDNSTVTTFEYTGGSNGAEVKLYRVNGGGHTWPGVTHGTLRAPQVLGVNNEDILAGQEIWDFFNKFELNQ